MTIEHVILSAAQATTVRGISTPGHALDPRELTDGKFALPSAILTDPAHAKHKSLLQGLTRRNPIAEVEWKVKPGALL